MHSRFARSWLAAVAAVVVLLPVLPGRALGAAAPGDATAAGFVDPAVASLAREYHLPVAEAEARIVWQHRAGDLQPRVEARMGGSFGGMWISQADGGRVRLGVAGDAAAIALAHRVLDEVDLAEVTDVVPVKYSLRDLLAARDAAVAELRQLRKRQPHAPTEVGVRTSHNSVAVSLPPSGFGGLPSIAVAASLIRSLGDAITVDFTAQPAHPSACVHPYCDPPLRAGVRIGNTKGGCTAGFPARSRTDNVLYIMTAGHCGILNPDLQWRSYFSDHETWRWIGYTLEHRRVYGTNGDMQIIKVSNYEVWKTRAWVFVRSGHDTVRDADYPIWSDGNALSGDRVCMSGATSGTDCGEVLNVWACRVYWDEIIREVCGINVANYRSADGDSGGPVFSYHKALGLHSGKNNITGNSFYMPIRAAEDGTNVDVSFTGTNS